MPNGTLVSPHALANQHPRRRKDLGLRRLNTSATRLPTGKQSGSVIQPNWFARSTLASTGTCRLPSAHAVALMSCQERKEKKGQLDELGCGSVPALYNPTPLSGPLTPDSRAVQVPVASQSKPCGNQPPKRPCDRHRYSRRIGSAYGGFEQISSKVHSFF